MHVCVVWHVWPVSYLPTYPVPSLSPPKQSIAAPNILSLSAGGYGNVVLPLVKGLLPYAEMPQGMDRGGAGAGAPLLPPPHRRQQDVGFYGNLRGRTVRPKLLAALTAALGREGVQVHARFV